MPNGPRNYRQDFRSILMITEPFHQVVFSKYIDRGRKKKLFKGEEIRFKTRSIDDPYFYYVEEGQIAARLENAVGESTVLYYRNAGNAFSAESFDYASIGQYKAKFIATENSVLFAFSQRELYDLMLEDPEVFYEFVRVCHMSFAQMGHRISGTGSLSAVNRVVMWLQKLCAITEPNADGSFTIDCTMTLQQISEQLLIHITTCTKIFSMLEDNGVISRTRKQIKVLDPKRLADYSLDETRHAY